MFIVLFGLSTSEILYYFSIHPVMCYYLSPTPSRSYDTGKIISHGVVVSDRLPMWCTRSHRMVSSTLVKL